MTTKNKALNELKKIHPNAELIDDSDVNGYVVNIDAPKGMHWENDDVHSRVCFFHNDGKKDEFWKYVIEEIKDLGNPIKCSLCNCSEWDYDDDICDFWNE